MKNVVKTLAIAIVMFLSFACNPQNEAPTPIAGIQALVAQNGSLTLVAAFPASDTLALRFLSNVNQVQLIENGKILGVSNYRFTAPNQATIERLGVAVQVRFLPFQDGYQVRSVQAPESVENWFNQIYAVE